MTWTTQPCILHLLTRMVSKITSTFKMIFKSRHPFDEIHFVLRTDWLIEKLGNQRFFAITLSISKKRIENGKIGGEDVNNCYTEQCPTCVVALSGSTRVVPFWREKCWSRECDVVSFCWEKMWNSFHSSSFSFEMGINGTQHYY